MVLSLSSTELALQCASSQRARRQCVVAPIEQGTGAGEVRRSSEIAMCIHILYTLISMQAREVPLGVKDVALATMPSSILLDRTLRGNNRLHASARRP